VEESRLLKKRAYKFSLRIIEPVSDLQSDKVGWVIGKRLLRSGTSIGANLMEAKAASSRKDFINYFQIALKSANETRYWLYLLRDSNIYEGENLYNLLDEVTEISNMIGSSVLTLKGR